MNNYKQELEKINREKEKANELTKTEIAKYIKAYNRELVTPLELANAIMYAAISNNIENGRLNRMIDELPEDN